MIKFKKSIALKSITLKSITLRSILLIGAAIMMLTLFGCSKKGLSIYDISELRKEMPESATIYPDDPSAESITVTDTETINRILSYYTARKYYERKSGTPAPGSNAHVEFHYKDGTAVKLPVDGFKNYELSGRYGLGDYVENLK